MRDRISLFVNGKTCEVQTAPDTPLLYVLRDELGLLAAKYGCGVGQCGACRVQLGSQAVASCSLPVEHAQGQQITTLEGIGTREQPHPLQLAFLAENAGQCGYCVSGIIMTARALWELPRVLDEAEIRDHLSENLCRCGSYPRYVRAVLRAFEERERQAAGRHAAGDQ